LGLDPAVLAGYGGCRDRTRTEHLRQVLDRLDWRPAPLIARWGTLPLEAGAELAGWMTGGPSEAHG